jgi:hypothetical protein
MRPSEKGVGERGPKVSGGGYRGGQSRRGGGPAGETRKQRPGRRSKHPPQVPASQDQESQRGMEVLQKRPGFAFKAFPVVD